MNDLSSTSLSQTQQQTPEQETLDTQHGPMITGEMGSVPPPPDDLARRNFRAAPETQRQQHVIQLQRQMGNAAVQRYLAQQSGVVQRQGGGVGLGTEQKGKIKDTAFPIGKRLGPIPVTAKSISFSGEYSWKRMASAGDKAASTKATVGGAADLDLGKGRIDLAVQGKIEEKLKLGSGAEFAMDGSAKIGTSGIEAKIKPIGLDLFDGVASFGIEFKFLDLKYDGKGMSLDLLTINPSFGLKVISGTYVDDDGSIVEFSFKPKVELTLEPDYSAIGQWLTSMIQNSAAASVGFALTMVAGGFLTAWAAVETMALGTEISGRSELAAQYARDYIKGYAATMRGEAPPGGSEWVAKGIAVAEQAIAASDVPFLPAIHEAAQKRDLYSEAWGRVWPQIKSQALESYKTEHKWEWRINGENGPGYRNLVRVLEAIGG